MTSPITHAKNDSATLAATPFHIAQTRELGGYLCGRRLYETTLPWETDPSMRDNELGAAFADVWCAIPKGVRLDLVETRTFGWRVIYERYGRARDGSD
jgi:hypothetical protein